MPRPRRKHGPLAPPLPGVRPSGTPSIDDIPVYRRRQILRALSVAKAAGRGADEARFAVAREYVVTVMKVEAVEVEGLAKGWIV